MNDLKEKISQNNKKVNSLWNKVKQLFCPGRADYFYQRIAPNNWPGVPKENLTHEEVSKITFPQVIPMVFDIEPEICPKCGNKLEKYKSDWWKIEKGGQYMVRGAFCRAGCYTYLDCA